MLKIIKSKYILENIFKFIKDNRIKLKLIFYSKYFQNLFDNFQKEFLHSLDIIKIFKWNFYFDKNDLRDSYNQYIKSLNNIPIDVIERYIADIIAERSKVYWQTDIDIYSPYNNRRWLL